ncbi:hypothetical protein F5Y09DRAFT_321889 [Xylaria sp. FL1042]|nr:hypothetical protein F5Y09DRAFT_321889 [Xylaria sp. FL1042]
MVVSDLRLVCPRVIVSILSLIGATYGSSTISLPFFFFRSFNLSLLPACILPLTYLFVSLYKYNRLPE